MASKTLKCLHKQLCTAWLSLEKTLPRIAQRCPRGALGVVFFGTTLWALFNNFKDKTQRPGTVSFIQTRLTTPMHFIFATVALAEVLRIVLSTEHREERVQPLKASRPWRSTSLQEGILSLTYTCACGAKRTWKAAPNPAWVRGGGGIFQGDDAQHMDQWGDAEEKSLVSKEIGREEQAGRIVSYAVACLRNGCNQLAMQPDRTPCLVPDAFTFQWALAVQVSNWFSSETLTAAKVLE